MKKTLTYVALLAAAGVLGAETTGPKMFATPEEARDGLIQAAKQGWEAVRDLMGPGSAEILRTGDEVQDKALLEKFNERVAEKVQLEPDDMNPDQITLVIGNEEWPFAVPLMKKNGRWYFDIKEGKAEIRRRNIGANELDAIEVCRGFVEAEDTYASTDWNNTGVLQYAGKFVSSPGKKDGLYWPGEDSPVSEAIAKAMAEGYSAPTAGNKGYTATSSRCCRGRDRMPRVERRIT